MPFPWLRILDVLIGVTDLARSRKIRQAADQSEQLEAQQSLEPSRAGAVPGALEARLAGVVVAALKEAFELDTLFFSARLIGGPAGARVALAGGWLLLLLAFACAVLAQSQVAEALNRDDGRLDAGVLGALALWFIVAGLVLVGLAVLVT